MTVEIAVEHVGRAVEHAAIYCFIIRTYSFHDHSHYFTLRVLLEAVLVCAVVAKCFALIFCAEIGCLSVLVHNVL